MNRRFLGTLIAALLCGTLPCLAASYYVVLQDGTWAPAAGKPTVEGKMARIPLRSGLQALLPAEHIDWEASEKATEAGVPPDGPHAVPGQGLAADAQIVNAPPQPSSGSSTPSTPAPPSTPATPSTPSTPPPPPASGSDDEAASIRARIGTLDSAIGELKQQQADIRRQISSSYDLDRAAELRKDSEKIDKDIARIRDEKERLLIRLWELQS